MTILHDTPLIFFHEARELKSFVFSSTSRWITQNSNEIRKRLAKYCLYEEVILNCAETCDACPSHSVKPSQRPAPSSSTIPSMSPSAASNQPSSRPSAASNKPSSRRPTSTSTKIPIANTSLPTTSPAECVDDDSYIFTLDNGNVQDW